MNRPSVMRNPPLYLIIVTICHFWLATTVGCGSGSSRDSRSTSPPPPPSLWIPKSEDLRFQGLGSYAPYQKFLYSGINGGGNQSVFPQYANSPLQIGSGICGPLIGNPSNCFWSFLVLGPQDKSSTAVFTAGQTNSLESDLDGFSTPNTVINSLDIEPAWGAYAVSRVVSSSDNGFTLHRQHVASSDLAKAVQQMTSSGQIVTALSAENDGTFYVFSYSWTMDTASKYEATVVGASLTGAGTAMQTLASQGYFVTAVGADHSNGVQLVGTRLAGRTESRPSVVSVNFSSLAPDPFAGGYAVIGFLFDDETKSNILLFEK
jgi:hypothetical protein